jgi:glycosyltransferase involved in cell wall biosynthesis
VKNHEHLFRSFARAHTLLGAGRIHLDVAGDGPLRDPLRTLVAELGLADAVTFHGPVKATDVAGLMARVHAVVLTSKAVRTPTGVAAEEAISNALVEGAAMGRALLATRSGGIPEIVTHGVNGWLVDEDDIDGLATRMVEFADHPERVAAFGAASHEVALARFDLRAWNDRFRSLVHRCARSPREARPC